MQESAGTAAAGRKQVRLRCLYQQNSYDVRAAWRGYGDCLVNAKGFSLATFVKALSL